MRRSKTGARKMIVSPALECVLLLALECVVVPFIRMCSLTCIAPQQDRGAQDDRGHEHSGNFPHHQWRLCCHRRGVHQGPVSCLHFLFFSLLYFVVTRGVHQGPVSCLHFLFFSLLYFVVTCFHTPLCFTATCYHTLLYFTLLHAFLYSTLLYCMPFFTLLYFTLLWFTLLYFTLPCFTVCLSLLYLALRYWMQVKYYDATVGCRYPKP
jgi:hypothetical protein